jgi:hypothetical protein
MIEQANVNPVVAGPTANRLVPGYLFTPFGWAGQKLAAMTGPPEAGLLAQLFELDRKRMHLVALALAHLDCELTPELASFFLRASVREVLRRVLGHSPLGIRRVLSLLPFAVLSQQSYRYLVQLLDDPETRKLLQYLFDTELTDAMIRVLLEVFEPSHSQCEAASSDLRRCPTVYGCWSRAAPLRRSTHWLVILRRDPNPANSSGGLGSTSQVCPCQKRCRLHKSEWLAGSTRLRSCARSANGSETALAI